jgi:N-methylhydantoinase B
MTDHSLTNFDPISLEIYWSRLISIADEAATSLVRTAFSTIVRESNDYGTVIMDRNGDSLSENTGGIASFSCILPRTTKAFLAKFPAETWRPGDAVITNDPWLATGHLPDFTVVSPIFHGGRLMGFAGSISHSPDVGGSLWSADCQEIFEEGIRIRPAHLLRGGSWNEELLDLLLGNVRVPQQVFGDLGAQVVANDVAARRVGDFRATLEADGFDDNVTRIACAVSVSGDRMHIDYDGTSPQVNRGINCVLNYTHAYSVYPIKCALDPLSPRNEGSYRAITVAAPERAILNPVFPAPCNARQLTGHLLAGVIYKALAAVLPEKVIADSGGAPSMRAVFNGLNRDREAFSQVLFASGGMGAAPHKDGLSTTAFPTNVGAGSIEAYENVAPLLVWKKLLRTDSGGAGRFRGGLGQEIEVELRTDAPVRMSLLADRTKYPAGGLLGGLSGAPSEILLDDGTKPHPKSRTTVAAGRRVTLRYAGGGGYGDPRTRDRAAVLADLENGYVSIDAARQVYGQEIA